MFTGIIEELGKVVAIEEQPDAVRLTISGPLVTSDIKRGDSISCSGTCLTAIEIENGSFTADVMKETLRLTSLDGVKVGDPIRACHDHADQIRWSPCSRSRRWCWSLYL